MAKHGGEAADSMTQSFHNPFKRMSPLNKIFFAGAGICHSYNEHGAPYAGRHQCMGTTFTSKLLWTPNYYLKGRNYFLKEVKIGGHRYRPVMFVQRDAGANYVVIHTHGNGCDVGEMQPAAVEQAAKWKAHVVLPEYPGYGEAPGRATVKDVEWAVMSCLLFVLKELQVPHERIIVFGYSIGSGAACMLARAMCEMDMAPAALILHAPYTSLRGMAIAAAGCIGNVTFNRFKTKKNLPYITAPVLIMHGDRDEVIPFSMGEENFQARKNCKYPTEFFRQVGCSHGEYNMDQHVLQPGLAFLQKHVLGYRPNIAGVPPMAMRAYPQTFTTPPDDISQIHQESISSSKGKVAGEVGCMCGAMIVEAICGGIWLGYRFLKRTVCVPYCPCMPCVKESKLKKLEMF